MKRCTAFVGFLIIFAISFSSWAQSSDEVNSANNPLTPKAGLNFHDYITSSLYDSDEDMNTFLLRGTMPAMLGGIPQIFRVTLPYMTVPGSDGDKVSGIGDLNIFDIFLLKGQGFEYGIGPLLVMDTASKDETGAGKWQIGAAGILITQHAWGILGALITYQHDFAGDEDRATQNLATLQPLIIYNLPGGVYLRSTGVWNLDWETGRYYIPLGVGAGKVWALEGGTTINGFIEPQWTVAHEGAGEPEYQTFVGLNFQFPLGR